MKASEIVVAFESGLITQEEAVEQALCERLEEVYRKADRERWRGGKLPLRVPMARTEPRAG